MRMEKASQVLQCNVCEVSLGRVSAASDQHVYACN